MPDAAVPAWLTEDAAGFDAAGRLWVALNSGDVGRYNPATDDFTTIRPAAAGRQTAERLALTRRQGGFFALILIDLECFKQTNDTLGHDAGAALLVEVARRLRGGPREF